ncbi:hypothetical protein BD410DRAFT_306879 [Rickenella mellea]|uniref:Uncharacterized protein n=1 Tax=Rickenella mellea TaxID=50990 RepID=A0A4Y7Q1P0_9AGAM|nr:hypothetical protein BD410DRAFT_306879 [Rickenella mellea]
MSCCDGELWQAIRMGKRKVDRNRRPYSKRTMLGNITNKTLSHYECSITHHRHIVSTPPCIVTNPAIITTNVGALSVLLFQTRSLSAFLAAQTGVKDFSLAQPFHQRVFRPDC